MSVSRSRSRTPRGKGRRWGHRSVAKASEGFLQIERFYLFIKKFIALQPADNKSNSALECVLAFESHSFSFCLFNNKRGNEKPGLKETEHTIIGECLLSFSSLSLPLSLEELDELSAWGGTTTRSGWTLCYGIMIQNIPLLGTACRALESLSSLSLSLPLPLSLSLEELDELSAWGGSTARGGWKCWHNFILLNDNEEGQN